MIRWVRGKTLCLPLLCRLRHRDIIVSFFFAISAGYPTGFCFVWTLFIWFLYCSTLQRTSTFPDLPFLSCFFPPASSLFRFPFFFIPFLFPFSIFILYHRSRFFYFSFFFPPNFLLSSLEWAFFVPCTSIGAFFSFLFVHVFPPRSRCPFPHPSHPLHLSLFPLVVVFFFITVPPRPPFFFFLIFQQTCPPPPHQALPVFPSLSPHPHTHNELYLSEHWCKC